MIAANENKDLCCHNAKIDPSPPAKVAGRFLLVLRASGQRRSRDY